MTDNNIELKEFITKTLEDVCFGIADAQKNVSEVLGNYPIAPAFFDGKSVLKESDILFDIAITTSNKENKGKGAEIKINVLGASINKENSIAKDSVNRIQFSVPFYPQALNIKALKDKK